MTSICARRNLLLDKKKSTVMNMHKTRLCDIEESTTWFRNYAAMREVTAVASRLCLRFHRCIKRLIPRYHNTVIHFYFGADLISVISVQAFFTEIKSLPKFYLRVDGCSSLFKIVWIPLALPKFSPYRNGEFLLYRKLYATEIKVDYSTRIHHGSFLCPR